MTKSDDEIDSTSLRLIFSKEYNVVYKPIKHMVKGHFVPTISRFSSKKIRKIRVELCGPSDKEPQSSNNINPLASPRLLLDDWSGLITGSESVFICVLKITKKDFDDASVVSSNETSSLMASNQTNLDKYNADVESSAWMNVYKFSINNFQVLDAHGFKCSVLAGSGRDKKEVEYKFQSEAEARSFSRLLSNTKSALEKCSKRTFRNLVTKAVNMYTKQTYLIEIVSAIDLRKGKKRTPPDAHCAVLFGDQIIHKTEVQHKTCDPIWTVKSKAFFLFTKTSKEITKTPLVIQVKDHKSSLGQVIIPTKEILECQGKRKEYTLTVAKLQSKPAQGRLAIRCRIATEEDIFFMRNFSEMKKPRRKKSRNAVIADHSEFISPISKNRSVRNLTMKSHESGEKLYRIRPYPDPDDESTRFMSKNQIDLFAKMPSKSWIETGTGEIGSLYVEVLGCDGLPDLDPSLNRNNKTDSFVTLIFEETIVTTDVVSDCLSPRFLPWTRRAFAIKIHNASSHLLLGVFDYDHMSVDNHDPIGRVDIPTDKLAPNTNHIVTYDLFDSGQVSSRSSRGTITLRLRLKWNCMRQVFLHSLQPPPRYYINLEKKKDFAVARYIVHGKVNVYRYSLGTITSYLKELVEYAEIWFDVKDALKTVLLWRGHYQISYGKNSFKLPLHSMFLFVSAVCVVEWSHLAISFTFASIAWLMLANLEEKYRRPSPWTRPPTFLGMCNSFLTGRTYSVSIDANQNRNEDECFIEKLSKEKTRRWNRMKAAWDEYNKEYEDWLEVYKDHEDFELDAAAVGRSLAPQFFKDTLYPWQQQLSIICNFLRFIKNILTWEHPYISFWITFLSIALSIVTIFLWKDTLLWVKRVLVWTFLGPWMKLLDVYHFRKFDSLTDSDWEKLEEERARRRRAIFQQYLEKSQLEKEEVLKKAAFKKYLFGQYILSVPHMMAPDRFLSEPKPESFAVPSNMIDEQDFKNSKKIIVLGQTLIGDMIPKNLQDYVADESSGSTRSLSRDALHEVKEDKPYNTSELGG